MPDHSQADVGEKKLNLPQEFQEKMKRLLGEEYEAFLEGYDREKAQSLRVNTGKIAAEVFAETAPFTLRQVPWVPEGFYYGKEDRPGKHPYHEAGLYYIQEPSAMAVGALAGAKPGERVLDLCAAPGGKTTHLAASMKGEGLLVSNEIHPARAKILASNVERMGIPNAVVTNPTKIFIRNSNIMPYHPPNRFLLSSNNGVSQPFKCNQSGM